MPDKKISQLEPVEGLAGNELIPVVQGVANATATPAQIKAYIGDAAPTGASQNDGLLTHEDKAKLDKFIAGAGALTGPAAPLTIGTAAALAVGTTSNTVAAGDDSRITGALPASGGTLTNVKETRYAVTTSGNVTINLANGNLQRFILDAVRQFTLPADPGDVGQSFTLIIECATYAPTWNSSPAIKWLTVDNTAPTLTVTADRVNVVTFIWDDTDSRWLGFLAGVEL